MNTKLTTKSVISGAVGALLVLLVVFVYNSYKDNTSVQTGNFEFDNTSQHTVTPVHSANFMPYNSGRENSRCSCSH